MNVSDLHALPKTVREDLYEQFYSALLRAQEIGDEKYIVDHQYHLHALKELWQLSPAEISSLETHAIERRAYAIKVLCLLSELENADMDIAS